MKTHYEISLNYNDLFKNESLSQVINNLEKLDRISEDVFNRINKNILEKKTKLENLKSRINRASSIINSLETLPQALTIKSKRFYPCKEEYMSTHTNNNSSNSNQDDPFASLGLNSNTLNHTSSSMINQLNYKSIYYDDVCDFSLLRNNPVIYPSSQEINSKPSNHPSKLGKKPDGSLEDVTLCQEILNSLPFFKEIKSDLTITRCTQNLFNKNEIAPEIERVNSVFQFMDKSKVFGEKINIANITNSNNEPRESVLLNTFLKAE